MLGVPGSNILQQFNPGSYHKIVEIEADKDYEIGIYTKFGSTDYLPHDWSVVTWSDKEPMKITHNDGIESRSFFNVNLEASTAIPQDFEDNGKADHSQNNYLRETESFGPMTLDDT